MSLRFYDGVRGLGSVLGTPPNAYRQTCLIALYGERMSAEDRQIDANKAFPPYIKDAADRLQSWPRRCRLLQPAARQRCRSFRTPRSP